LFAILSFSASTAWALLVFPLFLFLDTIAQDVLCELLVKLYFEQQRKSRPLSAVTATERDKGDEGTNEHKRATTETFVWLFHSFLFLTYHRMVTNEAGIAKHFRQVSLESLDGVWP
jgi:hypothetical protein